MSEEKKGLTTLFAVRTTIGQEKSVANLIFSKMVNISARGMPVPDLMVILVAEQLRGYVFIEATHQRDVMEVISGIRHVKGKIVGQIKFEDISHVIVPRRVTEILEVGDIVEIVSGLFVNQRARIERMPHEGAREEVLVRLINSESPISIKVHGDFLKLVEKGEREAFEEPAEEKAEQPTKTVDIFNIGFEDEDEFVEVPADQKVPGVPVSGAEDDEFYDEDWNEYEEEDDDDWTKFDDLEEETY